MRRGPLFRLLGLENHVCPSCKRDVVHRVGFVPERCRWCGAAMLDWAAMTRAVGRLAETMGTSFTQATKAVTAAVNAFSRLMDALVWVVDVETATHDDLRAGETATRISRVQVWAPDEWTAKLVACQMATRPDRMPTRATLVTPAMLEEERAAEAAARSVWAGRSVPLANPLGSAVDLRKRLLTGEAPEG